MIARKLLRFGKRTIMTGKESVGWLKQSLEENDPEVSFVIYYAEKSLKFECLDIKEAIYFYVFLNF